MGGRHNLDQDSRGRKKKLVVHEVQSWERKATELVKRSGENRRWPMCANHKRAIISEPRHGSGRTRPLAIAGKVNGGGAPLCDEIPHARS